MLNISETQIAFIENHMEIAFKQRIFKNVFPDLTEPPADFEDNITEARSYGLHQQRQIEIYCALKHYKEISVFEDEICEPRRDDETESAFLLRFELTVDPLRIQMLTQEDETS